MGAERHVSSNGYVTVRDKKGVYGKPGAFVPEHRLVMANQIGRPLRSDELVHHRDLNKSNNDPDNLVILTISEHGRVHSGGNVIHSHERAYHEPPFDGTAKWVKMRCPHCGAKFFKPRCASVLAKPNKSGMNFCSAKCAADFADALERGEIRDVDDLKRSNVVCEFTANGAFMREFVAGRFKRYRIDDSGNLIR